jgi:phospholipase D1/2
MMPAAVPLTHRAWEPILAVGRNCWAIAEAQSAGLLIDGDNFYRGFYEAARQAQHSILLAGWKFNSDVRLLRGRRAESVGNDVRLVPFLAGLCAENPRLQVHVLAWDFSVNYALEWERHQQRPFEEAAPGQVHFQFDAHHATGGSHHQKLVVVDSNVAFVGGLDLNADGWDRRRSGSQRRRLGRARSPRPRPGPARLGSGAARSLSRPASLPGRSRRRRVG